MTQPNTWIKSLSDWRSQSVLPLWSSAGIDPATQSAWEALDHDGNPLPLLNRRQRVQFRQAYAFARSDQAELQDLAWALFRRTMDHGFDPDTGLFSAWVRPDLSHLDQLHDLYDLAFGVLAASALGQIGRDVAADITRLEAAVNLLRADKGWHETAAHRLPRRQNPHMHLFEASTALYALTRADKHRAMAQECLDIIATYGVQKNGELLEFFAPDWTPLEGNEQAIEPGHMAEWVYLADAYETVMGVSSGLPLAQMWQATLAHQLPSGFLPDVAGGQVRRLWPQTELLKASVVMTRKGATLPDTAQPTKIAAALWDGYMSTPVAGGWYDKFDESGTLLSDNMPASTYYHIDVAIDACQSLER